MDQISDMTRERNRISYPPPGTDEYYDALEKAYNRLCEGLNAPDISNYRCPFCRDQGGLWSVARVSEIPQMIFKTCSCNAARSLGRTVNDFQAQEEWQIRIKKNANHYIANSMPGEWFFVGGQVGAGKSLICEGIASAYQDKGLGVEIMRWNADSMNLKRLVTEPEYAYELGRFQRVPILVIDDMFVSNPSEADVRLAREILDYRYDHLLRTIINSEHQLTEIRQISEGLASRISERAKMHKNSIARDSERDYRRS